MVGHQNIPKNVAFAAAITFFADVFYHFYLSLVIDAIAVEIVLARNITLNTNGPFSTKSADAALERLRKQEEDPQPIADIERSYLTRDRFVPTNFVSLSGYSLLPWGKLQ